MTGQAHWLTALVVLLGGAFVVALVLRLGRSSPRVRLVSTRFRCPIQGIVVSATVVEDAPTHRRIDVQSCSAFAPANAIRCAKPCVVD
jgi:hypothetical protein